MAHSLSLVHVVRPATPDANAPATPPPLLLLLHGVGANEGQMTALAPAFDPRCIVVSVRSPLVLGPNAFGWFHVRFTSDGPVIAEEEAAAAWAGIAAFAGESVQAYGADPARVYVGGFSQGGIVALAALLTAPDRFAGAFCLSGRLLPEVLPHVEGTRVIGKPVLVVHGKRDPKLGVELARWAKAELDRLQLSLTYVELLTGHEITRDTVAQASTWLAAQLHEGDRQPHAATPR